MNSAPLRALAESPRFAEAFPGQTFHAYPGLDRAAGADVSRVVPRGAGRPAAAESRGGGRARPSARRRHPPGPGARPARAVGQAAGAQVRAGGRRSNTWPGDEGLFVGVEYHKRFDRRALDARRLYRDGPVWRSFRCGDAKLVEPYYYRHSNFQNWFTRENSDPFTYIGCHYVDLVYFITGLRPVEVSVRGVEGKFPNGNLGYLWSNGQVVWENGAILSLTQRVGISRRRRGHATIRAYACSAKAPIRGGVLRHDDQFRGVSHGYVDPEVRGRLPLRQPRLLPPCSLARRRAEAGGLWLRFGRSPGPCGRAGQRGRRGLGESEAPEQAAQQVLEEIDRRGIMATPANSSINEWVTESARESILHNGRRVTINYGEEDRS